MKLCSKERPRITLVKTSNLGTRLNCWKIMAQFFCHSDLARPSRDRTSLPEKKTSPDVVRSSRLITRRRVDLPAPERPMMPTICGFFIENETSFTATTSPKRFVTFLISSTVQSPVAATRSTENVSLTLWIFVFLFNLFNTNLKLFV